MSMEFKDELEEELKGNGGREQGRHWRRAWRGARANWEVREDSFRAMRDYGAIYGRDARVFLHEGGATWTSSRATLSHSCWHDYGGR